MKDTANVFFFFPGSSGVSPNLSVLNVGAHRDTRFAPITYPGWKRYSAPDFSAAVFITELAAQVERLVPEGPIRIMGHSMGGHFGYATALYLQSKGRQIAGFCAIDSFLITTAAPTEGWQGRALDEALKLLTHFKLRELIRFTTTRFWRALLRLAGARISSLAIRFSSNPVFASLVGWNPTFEAELSLRLMVREIAPWLAQLDVDPVALDVPAALIRLPATASSDEAWGNRCPRIRVFEIDGNHHTLFDPENAEPLRSAFLPATAAWQVPADLKAA